MCCKRVAIRFDTRMGYGSVYPIDVNVIRGSGQKTIVGTRILRVSLILFPLGFIQVRTKDSFSRKFLNHKKFPRLSRAGTGAQPHDQNPGLFCLPVPRSFACGSCLQGCM